MEPQSNLVIESLLLDLDVPSEKVTQFSRSLETMFEQIVDRAISASDSRWESRCEEMMSRVMKLLDDKIQKSNDSSANCQEGALDPSSRIGISTWSPNCVVAREKSQHKSFKNLTCTIVSMDDLDSMDLKMELPFASKYAHDGYVASMDDVHSMHLETYELSKCCEQDNRIFGTDDQALSNWYEQEEPEVSNVEHERCTKIVSLLVEEDALLHNHVVSMDDYIGFANCESIPVCVRLSHDNMLTGCETATTQHFRLDDACETHEPEVEPQDPGEIPTLTAPLPMLLGSPCCGDHSSFDNKSGDQIMDIKSDCPLALHSIGAGECTTASVPLTAILGYSADSNSLDSAKQLQGQGDAEKVSAENSKGLFTRRRLRRAATYCCKSLRFSAITDDDSCNHEKAEKDKASTGVAEEQAVAEKDNASKGVTEEQAVDKSQDNFMLWVEIATLTRENASLREKLENAQRSVDSSTLSTAVQAEGDNQVTSTAIPDQDVVSPDMVVDRSVSAPAIQKKHSFCGAPEEVNYSSHGKGLRKSAAPEGRAPSVKRRTAGASRELAAKLDQIAERLGQRLSPKTPRSTSSPKDVQHEDRITVDLSDDSMLKSQLASLIKENASLREKTVGLETVGTQSAMVKHESVSLEGSKQTPRNPKSKITKRLRASGFMVRG